MEAHDTDALGDLLDGLRMELGLEEGIPGGDFVDREWATKANVTQTRKRVLKIVQDALKRAGVKPAPKFVNNGRWSTAEIDLGVDYMTPIGKQVHEKIIDTLMTLPRMERNKDGRSGRLWGVDPDNEHVMAYVYAASEYPPHGKRPKSGPPPLSYMKVGFEV